MVNGRTCSALDVDSRRAVVPVIDQDCAAIDEPVTNKPGQPNRKVTNPTGGDRYP
jgi:hypothetical protein